MPPSAKRDRRRLRLFIYGIGLLINTEISLNAENLHMFGFFGDFCFRLVTKFLIFRQTRVYFAVDKYSPVGLSR